MSDSDRDESGRFTESVTEQDILKVFDAAEAPFLTAAEVAEELSLSRQAANYRLKQMQEKDLVDRKKTGSRSAAWWAKRAPALSDETLRDLEAAEGELERGETVSHAVLKADLKEASDPAPDAETAADRVGGRGLFIGDEGKAFAEAVDQGREEFAEGYEERQDDLFGQ